MSMWEIEALTEEAVALVGRSHLPLSERRAFYSNLYAAQYDWDCSYTQFRHRDLLAKDKFLFAIPIAEHPDADPNTPDWYKAHQHEKYDYWTKEHESGVYLKDDQFWFDMDTDFWKRLVELGHIKGEGAEPVPSWDRLELIQKTVELAIQHDPAKSVDVAKGYYGFALHYMFGETDSPETRAKLQPIYDLARSAPHFNIDASSYIEERFFGLISEDEIASMREEFGDEIDGQISLMQWYGKGLS